MTNLQKTLAAFFFATRAGRGGGLLLMPIFFLFVGGFWIVHRASALLSKAIVFLVSHVSSTEAKNGNW